MGDDDFDAEMHEADWEDVYERQVARGSMVPIMAERLGLAGGDSVLELGSGPGYTALCLADRVAPGQVYAVDRHPDALQYLRDKATTDDIDTIRTITADVEHLPVCFTNPITTLAAFMLHHTPNPKHVLSAVHESIPPGSRVLVVEYEPDAPGTVGPPLDHRISPTQVTAWLDSAGFTLGNHETHPEEKYSILADRA